MRRTVVAVALLLVVSGCNAFPTGGSEDAPEETLTPAEVPTAESLRTPTATPTECLAPRVAAPDRSPAATPTTPAPLPTENGTVRGAALVTRHAAALANYSYALRMDGTRVESMPGATAFTYEGVTLGFESVQMFAVAGTVYHLHQTGAGVSVTEQPYPGDAATREQYLNDLTGRDWLAERVGPYNYTRVDTRTWNGTEVRVFRDDLDAEILVGAGEALSINSTVLVDRRGVVRHVRHVRTVRSDDVDEVVNTTDVETLSVPEVGTVTVERPEAFCVPRSEVVTATDSPTETDPPGTATANG
ncbi:hypothetical protein [Halosimplex salinum]|uniref:hypothetical protein n=1 Tax=Halosimplex salinum TaxID=1710538 RepID=UPI000F4AB35C|nr:hypothetical protein [Halosimplex salinum]